MDKNKIKRIDRDTSKLNFVIRFPKGKTYTDIQDIIFLVKETDATALENALITKLMSNSEIELVAPESALVSFTTNDYDPLEIATLYRAALFCKWNDTDDFDENVERLFDFEITQNFHNNN
jgi:spore coat protein CotH